MQIINARFLSGVSLLFGSIALWFYNDEQNGWVWYTFATLAVLTAALAAWSAYFENRVSERSSSGSVSSPHKPADETTENTKKQTDRRQTIWKRMTDKNVIESFSGYGSIPRTKKTKKKNDGVFNWWGPRPGEVDVSSNPIAPPPPRSNPARGPPSGLPDSPLSSSPWMMGRQPVDEKLKKKLKKVVSETEEQNKKWRRTKKAK